MADIDFTPLLKLESKRQRNKAEYLIANTRRGPKRATRFFLFGTVFSIFAFLIYAASGALFFLLAVSTGIWLYIKHTKRKKAYQEFAAINNWALMDSRSSYYNSLTSLGANCFMYGDTSSGQIAQTSRFWLYRASVIEWNSITFFIFPWLMIQKIIKALNNTYTVMTLDIGRELPTVFLDSLSDGKTFSVFAPKHKTNAVRSLVNSRIADENIADEFAPPSTTILKLEGNFSTYFDLHIISGNQIEALTLLTPDVMQVVIDHGAFINIFATSTQIHLISRLSTTAEFTYTKNLFDCAQKLITKLTYDATKPVATNPIAQSIGFEPPILPGTIITSDSL